MKLFEGEYEDEYSKLQQEFIFDRDEVEDFAEFGEDWFTFAKGGGTGIPCGASHISSSKTCRIEGGAPNFSRASDNEKEKLKAEYAEFEKTISGYSPRSTKGVEECCQRYD